MGWFSRFIKKVVAPIVEPIVEVVETVFIEPVVAYVVEPVLAVVTFVETEMIQPVVETLSQAVSTAVDFIVEGATTIVDTIVDVTINFAPDVALTAIEWWIDNKLNTEGFDFSRFDPVDGAPTKKHEIIHIADWTEEETVTIRDVVALTQVAFADFSELFDPSVAAVDAMGYVIDETALYEYETWLDGIEGWVQDRFDIIRVQEATLAPLYEANVTLFQNKASGDYTIGIGGTDGVSDIVTDAVLAFYGTTPGANAITGIIADFFANDIEGGETATVNLMGTSLGGAEARLQYEMTPQLFDEVYLLNSAGIGGFQGTYYDRNIWSKDKIGDARITEITGDDPGTDFNDLVTSLGHIGAGQTYFIDEIVNAVEFDGTEFEDSHLNQNVWASLPGGENPDLPIIETSEDVFVFV